MNMNTVGIDVSKGGKSMVAILRHMVRSFKTI